MRFRLHFSGLREGELLCREQTLQIEMAGVHDQLAGSVDGPVGAGAIPVELDTVLVGVAEVECFTDAVVGCTVELNAGSEQATEGVAEGCARGIDDGEVIEPRGAGRGGLAAETFPGVEADMMVIAAGGEEGSGIAHALGDVEAEDTVIEGQGAVEVGNAEMDVTHADAGMNGFGYLVDIVRHS